MTMTTTTTADPIRAALDAGYVLGVPPWCPNVEEVDRPVAEDFLCDVCGKANRYVALHHRGRRSYRAFARCSACRAVLEF